MPRLHKIVLVFAFFALSAWSQDANTIKQMLMSDPTLISKLGTSNGNLLDPSTSANLLSSTSKLNNNPNNFVSQRPGDTKSLLAADSDSIAHENNKEMRNLLPIDTNRFESRFFESNGAQMALPTGGATSSYQIKSGDMLDLSLWGEVEKTFSITIDPDGSCFVPNIGQVGLSGLTMDEAKRLLRNRLSSVYSGLQRGKIQLSLSATRMSPVKVFVLGEVARPGSYTLPPNASLYQALLLAHGPSSVGSVRNIQLRREGHSTEIDFYPFLFEGKQAKGSALRDGDVIFLPKAQKLVSVRGELNRPYTFELKKDEGLADLLRFAGGPTGKASRKSLVIERLFDDDRIDYVNVENAQTYFLGHSFYGLQNFDTVTVFRSAEESRTFVDLQGAIKYPGSYAFKDGLKLSTILKIAGGFRDRSYTEKIEILRKLPDGSRQGMAVLDKDYDSFELQAKDSIFVFDRDSIRNEFEVNVTGPVKHPGFFPFHSGLKVNDLILTAGGALPEWDQGKVQLEHAMSNGDYQVESIDLSQNDVEVKPRDRVVLLPNPNYRPQEVVTISGAFARPGKYAKANRGEKLSAFLDRVGAQQPNAYASGALFFRSRIQFKDTSLVLCLKEMTQKNFLPDNKDSTVWSDSLRANCNIQIAKRRDSLVQNIPLKLPLVLKHDKQEDIVLQQGDSLFLPSHPISVTVKGMVSAPGEVLYKEGADVSYYILHAGGFGPKADEDRVVVRFANGDALKAGWGTDIPDPGAEIIVPELVRDDHWMTVGTFAATALTAMATVLSGTVSTLILLRK